MKTHCTFAAAILALAAATGATGAFAASLNAEAQAEAESTLPATASTLTTEAVVSDLVRFRQSEAAAQQPRDGEWYNVPAPLGNAAILRAMHYNGAGPAAAQTPPTMLRTDQNQN